MVEAVKCYGVARLACASHGHERGDPTGLADPLPAKLFKIRRYPLSRLFDQVLALEPWDTARHTRVREAWAECGRQAPGYLKEGGSLVQEHATRLARQVNDPTAKPSWKTYPEVKRKVEEVLAKLVATRQYRDEFGPHQQQGAVEFKKSNLTAVETACVSPEQPAMVQKR